MFKLEVFLNHKQLELSFKWLKERSIVDIEELKALFNDEKAANETVLKIVIFKSLGMFNVNSFCHLHSFFARCFYPIVEFFVLRKQKRNKLPTTTTPNSQ